MGCAQIGTLRETGSLDDRGRELSFLCWIKEIGGRGLKLLTRLAYRSSRFWTAYLS